MAKSFKGYGAMWSKPNEPEKEDDKQAHRKDIKQAHEKEEKQTPIKEKVESEPTQAQESNKKTPDKSIKQAHDKENIETPNNSFIQENKQAHDNINNKAHDNTFIPENKETPIKKRGRGRPKMDTTEKKTHFNLLLRPATITALNTIAGKMQAETGKRVTVTGLITQLIDEFVTKQQEGA